VRLCVCVCECVCVCRHLILFLGLACLLHFLCVYTHARTHTQTHTHPRLSHSVAVSALSRAPARAELDTSSAAASAGGTRAALQLQCSSGARALPHSCAGVRCGYPRALARADAGASAVVRAHRHRDGASRGARVGGGQRLGTCRVLGGRGRRRRGLPRVAAMSASA
jgi:hypothetical protein